MRHQGAAVLAHAHALARVLVRARARARAIADSVIVFKTESCAVIPSHVLYPAFFSGPFFTNYDHDRFFSLHFWHNLLVRFPFFPPLDSRFLGSKNL